MGLTSTQLDLLLDEVRERLSGAAVQKAFSPESGRAVLELRAPKHTVWLELVGTGPHPRLAEALARPKGAGAPSALQKWLRQELTGARLVAAERRPSGAAFRFRRQGVERALLLELGRGLVLLKSDDTVLCDARPGRPAQPGGAPLVSDAPPLREGGEPLEPIHASFLPLLAAAHARWGEKEAAQRAQDARRAGLKPLHSRRARTLRTIEKVTAESKREGEAEAHRRLGELVSQNQHRLQRGLTKARLTEYTAEGPVEKEVPLDPALSPQENAERHFRQYRRLMKGSAHARQRLVTLREELEKIDAAIAALERESDAALLARAPAPPRKTPAPKASPYRAYRAAKGEPIWVGKNAQGNDTLTFQLAKPNDLWLHVRGAHGSHVVVPLPRGATVPPEVLLDAAHLALHHSDLKGEPRGEVSYTHIKYVKKVRGGAPGSATYVRDRTLMVRIEPDRLERLLRSADPVLPGP